MSSKISAMVKSIGTLILLLIAFPFNLFVVFLSLIIKIIVSPFSSQVINPSAKTVLITGGKMTKALQLARSFHQAGHRVILVETEKYWLSGHQFSQAVSKFYTVSSPEKNSDDYCQQLLNIVKKEGVDVFIPVSSPIASYYDSLAKPILSPYCEVLHFDAEMTKILDDKSSLCDLAWSYGLSAPKSFLITNPSQILNYNFEEDDAKYILKSIKYDSVYRLNMTQFPFEGMKEYVESLPINEENPWVMQQFIQGQEYCTHSTVRNGKIRLHCCSKSSHFQVNYRHEENEAIYQWVREFVAKSNLTGQISFDFIQTKDGTVYPIECNPRTHSAITMFYNHPQLAEAYLTDAVEDNQLPITPLSNSKPTYWLYHEIWRLTGIRSTDDLKKWWHRISEGTDAIFQVQDPLPFLMVHHWQIPLLILGNLQKLKDWVKIDFNIGKLIEIAGD